MESYSKRLWNTISSASEGSFSSDSIERRGVIPMTTTHGDLVLLCGSYRRLLSGCAVERDVVYETHCRDECKGPRSSTLSDMCVPMSLWHKDRVPWWISNTHEESSTFKYLVAALGTFIDTLISTLYDIPFFYCNLDTKAEKGWQCVITKWRVEAQGWQGGGRMNQVKQL